MRADWGADVLACVSHNVLVNRCSVDSPEIFCRDRNGRTTTSVKLSPFFRSADVSATVGLTAIAATFHKMIMIKSFLKKTHPKHLLPLWKTKVGIIESFIVSDLKMQDGNKIMFLNYFVISSHPCDRFCCTLGRPTLLRKNCRLLSMNSASP